jgi:release factor glutamine methyltransferase
MQNQQIPVPEKWTILSLLRWTAAYFYSHQIDSPRATAEILLAFMLQLDRIDLYLRYDQPLTESELGCFKALVRRRVRHEPVAYITGN